MKYRFSVLFFTLLIILLRNNSLFSQSAFSNTDNLMDTIIVPNGVSSYTTCNAKIFDVGGASGNYPNGSGSTITIYPSDSCALLQISGTGDLSVYDYLKFYDGVGIEGPLLATYTGHFGTINPFRSLSGPITIKFYGYYGYWSGFNLNVMCVSGCKSPVINSYIAEDNAIHLSWDNCSSTFYELQYKSIWDSVWNFIPNITTEYFSLFNLMYLTEYEIKIRSFCDTSYSAWNSFSASTVCPEEITLPFYEDFRDTLTCLTFSEPNKMVFNVVPLNTDAPYLPAAAQNYMIRYNGSTYGTNTFGYFITPKISNLDTGDEIRYWYFRSSQSNQPGSIQIYVNSEPSLTGAVQIQEIPRYLNTAPTVPAQGFYKYRAFVPSDTFSYVIFKTVSIATAFHLVDKISIVKGSLTCPSPSSINVSNVNTNSLTLDWTETGTATEWQIEYGPFGYQSGSGTLISNITTKPHQITGLPFGEFYEFKVRSIKQAGDTSAWSPRSLGVAGWLFTKTGTTSITSCQLRYFDNGGPLGSYSINYSGTLVIYPSNPNSKLAVTGTYSLQSGGALGIYSGTTTTGTNLVPSLNLSVPTISQQGPLTIFFHGGSVTGEGCDLNIFCVDSSCWTPMSLNAQNITHNKATISWTHYYLKKPTEIAFKKVSDTTWIYTYTDTTLFEILSGLVPNSTYQYKIRAICAPGDSSSYSETKTFTTECQPATFLFEDFESVPIDSIPSCWKKYHISSNTKVIAPNGFTNSNCLQITSTSGYGIILPKIENLGNGTHQLRIKMRPNSNLNYIQLLNVGYMSDFTNLNTFVSLQLIPLVSVDFKNYIIVPPSGLSGNYIALRGGGVLGQEIYIDEIYWEEIPSCTIPISLVSSFITDQSCVLTWESYGESIPNAWEVQYGPSGFVLGNGSGGIVSSDSITISGLMNATYYDFYIRAICSSTDTSAWSDKLSIKTYCANSELPVNESFDNSFINTSCWTITHSNEVSNTGFEIVTTGGSPVCYPQNGPFMLKYGSYSINAGQYALLFSPRLECNGSKIHITFYQYRDNAFTSSPYIGEGIAVFCNSVPSLVGADSIGFVGRQNSVNSWFKVDFLLPEGIVGPKYFIFKAISKFGSNQYFDNFNIEFLCPTPIVFTTVYVLSSEAYLSWQSYSINESFIIDYKKITENNWTSILNVTGSSYLLTGLDDDQTYLVRLRALCDTTGMSGNTPILTFTTPQECLTPSMIQVPDSLTTDSTATVLWDHVFNYISYEISYKPVSDADWITDTTDQNYYNITHLIPNQIYELRVKTLCANNFSLGSPILLFSTKCNTPTFLDIIDQSLTATSARLVWDLIENETEWNLNYRKVTEQEWTEIIVQDTTFSLSNLDPNTAYMARVQSLCGTNGSLFSDTLFFTTLILGIEQHSLSNDYIITPNPTDDFIEIISTNHSCEMESIEILNSLGVVLIKIHKPDSSLKIDLSPFSSGLYLIRIKSNLGVFSSRIIRI